jgi:hypothetical protein
MSDTQIDTSRAVGGHEMICCACGLSMRPVVLDIDVQVDPKPQCNVWYCEKCGDVMLDRTPRQKNEFEQIVAAHAVAEVSA